MDRGIFVPIRGDKARRYVNPLTGELISRRQYDQRIGRLKGVGASGYEKLQKANAIATGGRSRVVPGPKGKPVRVGPLETVAKARSFAREHKMTTQEAQRSPAFQQALEALQRPKGSDEDALEKWNAAIEVYGERVARQRYKNLALWVAHNYSAEDAA